MLNSRAISNYELGSGHSMF